MGTRSHASRRPTAYFDYFFKHSDLLTRLALRSNKVTAHKEMVKRENELRRVEEQFEEQGQRITQLERAKIEVENEGDTLKLADERYKSPPPPRLPTPYPTTHPPTHPPTYSPTYSRFNFAASLVSHHPTLHVLLGVWILVSFTCKADLMQLLCRFRGLSNLVHSARCNTGAYM